MRIRTALFLGGAALCAGLVVSPAAMAQSVFLKIFGIGAPPVAPRPNAVIPQHRFQNRSIVRPYQTRPRQEVGGDDEDAGPSDSGGPYKTMCVRTCDGYYFPIRHNARRKNFASDAKSCRNACGSDARLFYYSLGTGDGPDAMVDLAGRKYADMPHAFAYRKALLQGCACKRDPWSYEEAVRHQSYADQEAVELAKDDAFVKARDSEAVADAGTGETPMVVADVTPPDAAAPTPESVAGAAAVYDAATLAKADVPNALSGVQPDSAAKSDPVIVPRAPRRRPKNYVQRAAFKPASAPPSFGKAKYVWPGDSR